MSTYTLQIQQDIDGTPTVIYYTTARAADQADAQLMAEERASRFALATGKTVVGVAVAD